MKKIITFLLSLATSWCLSQGITVTVGEKVDSAGNADLLQGKDTSYFVDTATSQIVFGVKTFVDKIDFNDTLLVDLLKLAGSFFDTAGLGTVVSPIWQHNGTNWVIAAKTSGTANDADSLGGEAPAFYLARGNHTGVDSTNDIVGFQDSIAVNDSVVLNTTHRTSAGTDHSDVVLNNTHRGSDGSDHLFINQAVTDTSNTIFDTLKITALRINSPSFVDWDNALTVIQIGGVGAFWSLTDSINQGSTHFSQNSYFDGIFTKRRIVGFASDYYQLSGSHNFKVAASDAAGSNVSWINALFIKNTGEVGIGTTSIDASAILDIISTTKGFLLPRMTGAQRNAISGPAAGLQVYNNVANVHNFYNGTAWRRFVHTSVTTLEQGAILIGETGSGVYSDSTQLSWDTASQVLDVNGTIDADTIIINTTLFPDDSSGASLGTNILPFAKVYGDTGYFRSIIGRSDLTLAMAGQNLIIEGDSISGTPIVSGLWTLNASGAGGLTDYDMSVGDVDGSPTYGIMRMGNSVIGRTSYNVGELDLDGSMVLINNGSPVTGHISYIFANGSNVIRFALPSAGAGLGTYSPRSMIIAGPAILNDTIVYGSYWGFDKIDMATNVTGADLGVQDDVEVGGIIYVDSMDTENESVLEITANTNISGTLNTTALLTSQGLTFPDPGTSANSLNFTMIADNGGTPQTGTINVNFGANPYMRFSPPNAGGAATVAFDVRSDLMSFQDGFILSTNTSNDDNVIFQAWDNSSALTEVARLTSAVTPTFDLLAGKLTGDLDAASASIIWANGATMSNNEIDTLTITETNIKLDGVIILTDYMRHHDITASSATTGPTPPSSVTVGTFRGFEFNADNKSVNFAIEVPADWNRTSDMTLVVHWFPTSGDAVANGETVKWDATYRSIAEEEAVDNGTAVVATATFTGGISEIDKEHYEIPITIDYDNGNQPLSIDDDIGFQFDRDVSGDTYSGAGIVYKWDLVYISNTIPRGD